VPHARLVEDNHRRNTKLDEAFQKALRAYLLTQGIEAKYGVIIVALLEDGFDVVAVGPVNSSTDLVRESLTAIGHSLGNH
jgi:hypothetical protein